MSEVILVGGNLKKLFLISETHILHLIQKRNSSQKRIAENDVSDAVIRPQRVYHVNGFDFDAFDFSLHWRR